MTRARVFVQHSVTRTLTFSGAHSNRTLFFVLAIAFSQASLFAQAPRHLPMKPNSRCNVCGTSLPATMTR